MYLIDEDDEDDVVMRMMRANSDRPYDLGNLFVGWCGGAVPCIVNGLYPQKKDEKTWDTLQ